jgi:hypothetical protein
MKPCMLEMLNYKMHLFEKDNYSCPHFNAWKCLSLKYLLVVKGPAKFSNICCHLFNDGLTFWF